MDIKKKISSEDTTISWFFKLDGIKKSNYSEESENSIWCFCTTFSPFSIFAVIMIPILE